MSGGGHWRETEKPSRGQARGEEAIPSSTSAEQHLNSLSVFKHAKFIHTHPTQLTVF